MLLLLLGLFVNVNAQNITVSATTDTTVYQVGDYIRLTLELKYNKNVKVFLPPVKDSVKVLDYINTMPTDSSENNGKITKKITYIFSKYDSAKVNIPSLIVNYTIGSDSTKRFLATTPFSIVVNTLEVNSQEDIRDVKEPIKLPLDWLLIFAITLVIIALVVGGYYLYKYIKKKKQPKTEAVPELKIPPYEIALSKLLDLEQKKLWQNGMVKEYHSEITEIIRQYFEDRFNFRALEMTSAEILGVLSYLDEGKKILDMSNSFFSNADLVKFAKFQPMNHINEEMMKQAYTIVNSTIPEPPKVEETSKGDANV